MLNRKDVKGLLKMLNDADCNNRLNAAEALGEIADPIAIKPLIERLHNDHYDVSYAAGKALAKIGKPAIIPLTEYLACGRGLGRFPIFETMGTDNVIDYLLTSLKGNFNSKPFAYLLRHYILNALIGLLHSESRQAIETLIPLLDDYDKEVRSLALKALSNIDIPALPQYIQPLTVTLKNENPEIRQFAVITLGKTGASALNELTLALKDDEPTVRANAAEYLGHIGDRISIEPLLLALKDENPNVRKKAVWSLEKVLDNRDKHTIGPLTEALKDKDYNIKFGAASALIKIGQPPSSEFLLETLDTPWSTLDALKLLGQIKDESSVNKIVEQLQNNNGLVRLTAVNALIEIGSSQAVDALINRINDSDVEVRQAAVRALVTLGKPSIEALSKVANTIVKALQDKINPVNFQDQQSLLEQFKYVLSILALSKDEMAADLLFKCLYNLHYDDYALIDINKKALKAMGSLSVAVIVKYLHDLNCFRRARLFLEEIGWTPENQEDKAYWFASGFEWNKLIELGQPSIRPLTEMYDNNIDRVNNAQTLAKIGWEPKKQEEKVEFFYILADWEKLVSLGSVAVEPLARDLEKFSVSGTFDVDTMNNLTRTLARINDPRAHDALNAVLFRHPGAGQEFVTKIAAEKLDMRFAGGILTWLLKENCGIIPHEDLKTLFDEYWEIVESLIFKGEGLTESDAAVSRLCQIITPISSNILHLVTSRPDLIIVTGMQWDEPRYGTLSFEDQRRSARKELLKRGNPSHDTSAYLSKPWRIFKEPEAT